MNTHHVINQKINRYHHYPLVNIIKAETLLQDVPAKCENYAGSDIMMVDHCHVGGTLPHRSTISIMSEHQHISETTSLNWNSAMAVEHSGGTGTLW